MPQNKTFKAGAIRSGTFLCRAAASSCVVGRRGFGHSASFTAHHTRSTIRLGETAMARQTRRPQRKRKVLNYSSPSAPQPLDVTARLRATFAPLVGFMVVIAVTQVGAAAVYWLYTHAHPQGQLDGGLTSRWLGLMLAL